MWARRRKTAEQLRAGDRLIYYVTKHVAFGATAEIRSEHFEDHDPIWTSKPGEDYPWRVEIAPEVVIEDPDRWVPAESLYEELEFVKKWPRENWNQSSASRRHAIRLAQRQDPQRPVDLAAA